MRLCESICNFSRLKSETYYGDGVLFNKQKQIKLNLKIKVNQFKWKYPNGKFIEGSVYKNNIKISKYKYSWTEHHKNIYLSVHFMLNECRR